MGTPDTIYFKCPNCEHGLSLQVYGQNMASLEAETMCECRAIAWVGQESETNKRTACPNCKYLITLAVSECLRVVKHLKPVIDIEH